MSEINIERRSGEQYDIWLDVDKDPMNGLVVGVGETKAEALASAIEETEDILRALRNAWADEIAQTRSLKPTRTTVKEIAEERQNQP